jgi:hypothetical protein
VNLSFSPANLRDRLTPALKAPVALPLFVMLLGPVLWFYSSERLHHTDLWGHLAYGRLICQTRSLPVTEPFMPLAEGVPLVDTAWLTQVVGYLAISHWGPTAVQFLHALAVVACLGILAFCLHRRTGSIVWMIDGLAVFTALNWFQFQIVRPQMAGLICFLFVLALLSAPRWRPFHAAAIPLTFAAWANLHGSFVVGLALMGFACLGRAIDVWRRAKRPAAGIYDRRLRRLLVTTASAAVAVLVNPYGLKLYSEVLTFPRNPNLGDLIEWHPLPISGLAGEMLTGAMLCLVYWLSPRRVAAGEILSLIGFALAGLLSARMLIWWTPIAAGCFVIHARAAWCRFHPLQKRRIVAARSGIWTLLAIGLACLSFAATPFGGQALFGRSTSFERCVSTQTPVAAVRWLRENPPAGQLFNTYEWGDYIVWAGPRKVKVFVTSQAHLVPRQIWRDYMAVNDVSPGWQEILDRYRIETILIDKEGRQALISHLNANQHWQRIYDDDLAVIFTRILR